MDLYTRYMSIAREDIERFVSDAQEEHLTLDFKTVQDAALKRPDDKRSIARSLSGFANSEGGLIIWGVDARKNDRGIDAATALSPITELDRLVPRLNELTGEATSPVVEGVRHRAIDIGDNAGFGVTYVPESETGPYMARLGENRYYKRSGDSFYVMEHFDVQDMFGRRKQPKLELSIRITGTGSQTVIYLGIQNNGAEQRSSIPRVHDPCSLPAQCLRSGWKHARRTSSPTGQRDRTFHQVWWGDIHCDPP